MRGKAYVSFISIVVFAATGLVETQPQNDLPRRWKFNYRATAASVVPTMRPEPVEPRHEPSGTPVEPVRPVPSDDGSRVMASWYNVRPSGCWDRRGFHEHVYGDWWVAHRTLPCGTELVVTHNKTSIVVPVGDHGPAAWTGKSLDLSKAAFSALAHPSAGVVEVSYRARR